MTTKRILEIAQICAVNFGVTVPDIMSPRRQASIAWARQVAYWVAYKRCRMTMTQVAHAFNRKDHTTVSYAISRVDAMRDGDPEFAAELDGLADNACLAFAKRLGRREHGVALVEVEVVAA